MKTEVVHHNSQILPNKHTLFEELKKIEATDSQEQADAKIYFSFTAAVREYLRNRLNIRK